MFGSVILTSIYMPRGVRLLSELYQQIVIQIQDRMKDAEHPPL